MRGFSDKAAGRFEVENLAKHIQVPGVMRKIAPFKSGPIETDLGSNCRLIKGRMVGLDPPAFARLTPELRLAPPAKPAWPKIEFVPTGRRLSAIVRRQSKSADLLFTFNFILPSSG
jgi:hypothetical protein